MLSTLLCVLKATYEGRDPKCPDFIHKNLCTYSYMFKLQSSSKYSPLDAIQLLSLLKTVFEPIDFDAF